MVLLKRKERGRWELVDLVDRREYTLYLNKGGSSSFVVVATAQQVNFPCENRTIEEEIDRGEGRLRVLLTAFEPYDVWDQNSSWEALVEVLHLRGVMPGLTTRRYPVDLGQLLERLNKDLSMGFDAVLHLGQAPGASRIQLEGIALNVAGMTDAPGEFFGPLVPRGPVAYRTSFPLNDWHRELKQQGIPCGVSFHAGTYLCNAIMYLSHYWFEQHDLERPVGFVHIPLTSEQTLQSHRDLPSMSKSQSAQAVGVILDQILANVSETA